MTVPPVPCTVCGALLVESAVFPHLEWHEATGTLHGHTVGSALQGIRYREGWAGAGDDAPTAKLPPITDTVRRRPPVPPPAEVRELRGADLLRALAHQLESEDLAELDREDQGDDGPDDAGELRRQAAEFDRQAVEAMRERAERERNS